MTGAAVLRAMSALGASTSRADLALCARTSPRVGSRHGVVARPAPFRVWASSKDAGDAGDADAKSEAYTPFRRRAPRARSRSSRAPRRKPRAWPGSRLEPSSRRRPARAGGHRGARPTGNLAGRARSWRACNSFSDEGHAPVGGGEHVQDAGGAGLHLRGRGATRGEVRPPVEDAARRRRQADGSRRPQRGIPVAGRAHRTGSDAGLVPSLRSTIGGSSRRRAAAVLRGGRSRSRWRGRPHSARVYPRETDEIVSSTPKSPRFSICRT